VTRVACEGCKRFHPGPRCKLPEDRSVKVCVTLPGRVHRMLTERVAWGERSGWLARLAEKELDG